MIAFAIYAGNFWIRTFYELHALQIAQEKDCTRKKIFFWSTWGGDLIRMLWKFNVSN